MTDPEGKLLDTTEVGADGGIFYSNLSSHSSAGYDEDDYQDLSEVFGTS